MKKMHLALLTASLSVLNTSVQASQAQSFPLSPGVILSSLINQGITANFKAINHTIITEKNAPGFIPSPGDTFLTNGFGILETPFENVELTYSYNIAGTFTHYNEEEGKLFFNHGFAEPEATNQLMLYMDISRNANEDNASSYTDGIRIATMDAVVGNNDEIGYLQKRTLSGEDKVTFKLSDEDMAEYGFSDDAVLLNKITSEMSLADIASGVPQAYDFGAFDTGCGPINNPYDSCSREIGTSQIVLSSVPIPASLGLFLSGFGLLGWLKKRK